MKKFDRPKILAIASGGGHWIQLMRLRPAFSGADVTYASVEQQAKNDIGGHRFFRFPDANRERKIALIFQILRIAWIVVRVRPHVVVSTGASCGYVAIRLGRILGARTMFIDSIANAEKLSLSAQLAQRHANLTLTQWPHLESPEGPQYHGSVI
ncbi:MAG: UDP-N-acetylglucosamine--LPS N-acetylglucosamine transferase [Gammaproteobacteria bacterium]|jgi:UDP-N-acetylglucosamine:LPS N-acetylglucosamine transferase|nr:UDP-N-acetylglucosamine--LPS N-acetylglucosamine transferase [Gammaproteobacteria bacterium]